MKYAIIRNFAASNDGAVRAEPNMFELCRVMTEEDDGEYQSSQRSNINDEEDGNRKNTIAPLAR